MQGRGQAVNDWWIEDKERGRIDSTGHALCVDKYLRICCGRQGGNVQCCAGRVIGGQENGGNRRSRNAGNVRTRAGPGPRGRRGIIQSRCDD